jgi:glycosyltransferase involved in cell wall biosynthesis
MSKIDSRSPIFSVVTSFFGEGKKYVERLYDNISSQSVDWEWIVTDDFSSDPETESCLRNLAIKDSRVKYQEQKEKQEIFRNPQKYASGEFVFHIDADDQVHPNYLSHCLFWFRRFPKVICILSGSEWLKENGHFNRYAYHIQSEIGNKQDFIGRVWRNGFVFEFDKIFSNPGDVIRMNDMFIVKSFEKSGDILCLPRLYVKYEMRDNSNCNIERSDEEKEKIGRCRREFLDWNSQNMELAPYDTFFFDMEKDVLAFFALEWSKERKTIEYLGKSFSPYKQRKLKELYQDYNLHFDNLPAQQIADYRIIDCTSGFSEIPVGQKTTIVLLNIKDEDWFTHYRQRFENAGKIIRWVKLWDYIWMITLN